MRTLPFSVTLYASPLGPNYYDWNENEKVFSSLESDLVIDAYLQSDITFNTGDNCVFVVDSRCTFVTGQGCIFDTGEQCTFKTGSHCVFNVGNGCELYTIADKCILIRKDIFESYVLPVGKSIRLNKFGISGYEGIILKKNVSTPNRTELRTQAIRYVQNLLKEDPEFLNDMLEKIMRM